MNWKDQRLTDAVIKSLAGGSCKIRTGVPIMLLGENIKSTADANGYVLSFNSVKGRSYKIARTN
jgi:alpha-L-fucosidase 2